MRLLRPKEAADKLAIKPRTIREWLRDGELKGVGSGGKLRRIRESELVGFLAC